MVRNHPWYYGRRVKNGCILRRKKFACRSKGAQSGIVIKKSIPRQNDIDEHAILISSGGSWSCFILKSKRKYGPRADVEKQQIIPSSGDSSWSFTLERVRKYGPCNVEKQQIPTKKIVNLEDTPTSVLAEKIGFELAALVGYGREDKKQQIILSSGDSSWSFTLERIRKYGQSDVEKQQIPTKEIVKLEDTPTSVLAEKLIGFELAALVGYGRENKKQQIILSSGDSSWSFTPERIRKYGPCDVEKQQISTKKIMKLEDTPTSVLAEKIGFKAAIVGYGRENEYELLGEISSGSYGLVHKARDKETGEIVAMKEEYYGFCESSVREIDILKSVIRHPSFVEFKQVVVDQYGCVYVVMEYIENDLKRAMKSRKVPFQVSEVKTLMKQLLEGVNFLHENGIMHRDLKPSNILLNDKGELKICDFGLSRHFERTFDSYSPRVATLWYRAPELLVGAEKYSCGIDMWAVGCIMAELLLEEVLFKGNSEIDQLKKIYEILGTPNDIIWPGFSSLPGSILKFAEQPLINLLSKEYFSMLSEVGFDLLSKLLVYNPEERITAKDALNHHWFNFVQ